MTDKLISVVPFRLTAAERSQLERRRWEAGYDSTSAYLRALVERDRNGAPVRVEVRRHD